MANNQTTQQYGLKLNAETKQATSNLDEFKKSMRGLSESADAIKGKFATLGNVFAAVLGAEIIVKAKEAIDAADAMNDLAERTGVAASKLSEYQLAAKLSDTSIEGIGNGLKGLAKNMKAAADGNLDAANAFASIGVKATDSNGKLRDSEKVLLDVADAFSKMEDGPLKSAKAMEIFGKAGVEMIPLLNKGSDGIAEMKQRAIDLGIALSDETLKAVGDFNDALDTAGLKSKNGLVTMVAGVLPGLTDLVNLFNNVTAALANYAKAQSSLSEDKSPVKWAEGIKNAVLFVIDVMQAMKNIFTSVGLSIKAMFDETMVTTGGLMSAIGFLVKRDFAGAKKAMQLMSEDISKINKKLVEDTNKEFTSIRWTKAINDEWNKLQAAKSEVTKANKVDYEKAYADAKKAHDDQLALAKSNVDKQQDIYNKAKQNSEKALEDAKKTTAEFKKLADEARNAGKSDKATTVEDVQNKINDIANSKGKGDYTGAIEQAKEAMRMLKELNGSGAFNFSSDSNALIDEVQALAEDAARSNAAQAQANALSEKSKLESLQSIKDKLEQEPVKISLDTSEAKSKAETLHNEIQAFFDNNHIQVPISMQGQNLGTAYAAATAVPAGANTMQSNSVVNVSLDGKTYELAAPTDTANQLVDGVRLANLKANR